MIKGVPDSLIQRANLTAKPSERAIVFRYIKERIGLNKNLLDYGSGKSKFHTLKLLDLGYQCVPYDFGASSFNNEEVLKDKYEVVFASNVLNVQGSLIMLISTLKEIYNTDHKEFIFNYPSTPRFLDLTAKELLSFIIPKYKYINYSKFNKDFLERKDYYVEGCIVHCYEKTN